MPPPRLLQLTLSSQRCRLDCVPPQCEYHSAVVFPYELQVAFFSHVMGTCIPHFREGLQSSHLEQPISPLRINLP